MIIIKSGDTYKIISCFDVERYKKCKIIGILENDYPSLKSLEIRKKTTKEFLDYLNEKVKEHNRLIKSYKIQLKKFKEDLTVLGLK